MKHRCCSFLCTMLVTASLSLAGDDIPVTITEPVETEFGWYKPYPAEFTPAVEFYTFADDFRDVSGFDEYSHRFGNRDSILLRRNHFTVKYSDYKQMYDVYNVCTWNGTPVFISTDAVLHTYHVLFDQFLQKIESVTFIPMLNEMTSVMLERTQTLYDDAEEGEAKEALRRNLAFLSVGQQLITFGGASVHDSVQNLVEAELDLIESQDGYHCSPIFGTFTKHDYSQFQPRGHYTKSDSLTAYFRTCMWFGQMIFTMEAEKFGPLAERHTLQALALLKVLNDTYPYDLWENIYQPTVFFAGKTDDPNVNAYLEIARSVYGSDFLSLSVESLADSTKLAQFMAHAGLLPEPMIPNWIYGTFITYKGFRFMGQRFIPDSYMLAHLVLPYVPERILPKGLDIMSIFGSDRAYTLMDSVYRATDYTNYSTQIESLKTEFMQKPPEEWAQNLYWNWLYTLLPLLYEKGTGYPPFMRNEAWTDKELMTALASWTELRHDVILYAKQSTTPCCIPPDPPRSYVEPNPHLYARLHALTQYTLNGLVGFDLLLPGFKDKLDLFRSLLEFLTHISIKELENQRVTTEEYENMMRFGQVMKDLVSEYPDPYNNVSSEADNMAVVADVHTDSNYDLCLEEGVGYPLEIYVIINSDGQTRLTRGAIFSYYEFSMPISSRLTDERWRAMLDGENPPDFPEWYTSFMDLEAEKPEYTDYSPENIFHGEFTGMNTNEQFIYPQHVFLHQNYPNPFNPTTSIKVELPERMRADLIIYDILGRKITRLHSGILGKGHHEFVWDGTDQNGFLVSSGIYFYKLETEDLVLVKKMFLLR